MLTVGSLVSNPIDGGFGVLSSADNFMASIDALQTDPNVDMVLVQEGLPRAPGSDRTERYIRLADDYAATKATKPIAFVTPISHGQTDYSRALRAKAPHVSFLQEAYKALARDRRVARRDERERLARGERIPVALADAGSARPDRTSARRARRGAGRARRSAIQGGAARLWHRHPGGGAGGIAVGRARGGRSASAIPSCSRRSPPSSRTSPTLGAVALDLATPEQLAAAYDRMAGDLHGRHLAGMLVCRQIRGGLELALGLHRDPEMGLVVMAGSGGVLLELVKDVAFCAPPVSRRRRATCSPACAAPSCSRAIAARLRSTSTPSSTRWSRWAASPSTSTTSYSRSTSIRSSRCPRAEWRSMP